MDIFEYVEKARKLGIPLTTTHLDIYMREHTPKAEYLEYLGSCEIDPSLDPQLVLDKSEEYFASRKPICS